MSRDASSGIMSFPHRAIRKNVIAFLLTFPAVGLLLFFLLNPPSGDSPILRLQYDELPSNAPRIHHPPHNFTIHVWKHGKRMKRRFLKSYGEELRDPFKYCSVRNCVLTINDSRYADADAVMFHLHQTKSPSELPKFHPPHQVWIFFTDESPRHTFLASRKYSMRDYNGFFNWSMTYRSDSDVPAAYGRTVKLLPEDQLTTEELPNFAKIKNLTIAVLGSNCGGTNHRWDYIRELKKHTKVDIYGHCGKLKCPGHFNRDCPLIDRYKFYLAFENSNCREYLTEKLWWNAYEKQTVPVVMGAPRSDYERLCPPRSFIHVDDYSSPAELAKYIEFLDRNDTAYNAYFEWKTKYKVLNEHGYFGSPSLHLCRMCEKLNAKNSPKTYDTLETFWNVKKDCYPPSWIPKNDP